MSLDRTGAGHIGHARSPILVECRTHDEYAPMSRVNRLAVETDQTPRPFADPRGCAGWRPVVRAASRGRSADRARVAASARVQQSEMLALRRCNRANMDCLSNPSCRFA